MNPYFDEVRDPRKEIEAAVPADFEFEYIENITAQQLRYYFVQEILTYE